MINRSHCLLLSVIIFFAASGLVFADDHGGTFETATVITVGSITSGILGVLGDRDYFRFTASQAGVYVAYTRGERNTHGVLYDSNYQQLASDTLSSLELDNFRIVQSLGPGTYYVEVMADPIYGNEATEELTYDAVGEIGLARAGD